MPPIWPLHITVMASKITILTTVTVVILTLSACRNWLAFKDLFCFVHKQCSIEDLGQTDRVTTLANRNP